MSGLKINVDKINLEVIPNIKSGNKILVNISKDIESLIIPSGFLYGRELKGYSNQIDNIKRNMLDSMNAIENNVKDFKNVEKNNQGILSSFKIVTAKPFSSNSELASTGAYMGGVPSSASQANTYNGYGFASAVQDLGSSVIKGFKSTGATITGFLGSKVPDVISGVGENITAILCSAGNVVFSLLKGVASLAEHLVDGLVILLTGVGSIVTGATDLLANAFVFGYNSITGENYKLDVSLTAEMWKATMSFTSTEYVENAYKSFYQNTIVGQFLDEHAFSPFKSDGIVSGIAAGLGEVLGTVLLTVLTLGIGTGVGLFAEGSAMASTIVGSIVATINGFGNYTAEKWNNLKEEYQGKLKDLYEKGELTFAEFNRQKDNWTNIKNCLSGLGFGLLNGAWEGVQWGLGSYLNANKVLDSKLVNSIANITVDTLFNALDTPVRALTDSITGDKDLEKAFEDYGGVKGIIQNVVIGLIGSTIGEGIDARKVDNAAKSVKFNSAEEVAIFFNDPMGYLSAKFDMSGTNFSNEQRLARVFDLNDNEREIFNELWKNQREFTPEQIKLLEAFSKYTGNIYSAELRGSNVEFGGGIFKGKEGILHNLNDGSVMSFQDYLESADRNLWHGRNNISVQDDIRMIDNIIESSPALEKNIVVYRGCEALYKDGEKLLISPGAIFNDKGYTSTSAFNMGTGFIKDRPIVLEIEIPKGEKVAYIQQAASNITGYGMQEVLLKRNSSFEIVDVLCDEATKKTIVKAKLVKSTSMLDNFNITDAKSMKYYERFGNASVKEQISFKDMYNEMENNGLLAKFKAEARDIRNSGIYDGHTVPEHGMEHVEDVLFNALYIGEKEGLDSKQLQLLSEAAKWHDASKLTDGPEHAVQAAKVAEDYLGSFTKKEDINIIKAAIEFHAAGLNDKTEEVVLKETIDNYHIPDADREGAAKIAKILKDADAIDRTRFPGNLDGGFLRTDTAKKMVMASHQLQDAKGKSYMDAVMKTWDSLSIEQVELLRRKGISDYEIAFWTKNQPTENQYAIGLWYKIDSIIKEVLNR